jgi:hypothetical protein
LVQAAAFAGDDDTSEKLNTLFVTFNHPRVDRDRITHPKLWDVGFDLLFFDFGDDVAHGGLLKKVSLPGSSGK